MVGAHPAGGNCAVCSVEWGDPEAPLSRSRFIAWCLAVLGGSSVFAQAPPETPPAQTPAAPATAAPAGVGDPAASRLSRIQGTVILSRRNPVVGATVLLTALDPPRRIWVTSTDDRGEFKMDAIPAGSYRLEARRPDLASVIRDRIALNPPFRAVIELTMQAVQGGATPDTTAAPGPESAAGLHVAGRTVDRTGTPVPSARLKWVDAAGRRDPANLQSGDDGSFTMTGLPPGTWRLEVLGVGFLPVRVDLPVSEDTTVTAVLVKQSAGHEPLPLDLIPPEEPIPPPTTPKATAAAPAPPGGTPE